MPHAWIFKSFVNILQNYPKRYCRIPKSMKIYHVSKDILPKLIYLFVKIPIKIPVIFSFRSRQANSKIHM